MTKKDATKKFLEYVRRDYKTVKIVSVDEKKDRFLFEFVEEKDEFPIDYPIISVMKENGETTALSFLNAKDRKIIYRS